MHIFFDQLFDYNFFCNKKIIEQSLALKKLTNHSLKLFNHILNAHHIWNKRILEENHTFDVWQVHAISDWEAIHYENQRTTFEIITNTQDFSERISYETTEGNAHSNEIKDILFHIINHSTHHRGQILMDFRNNKVVPERLDYIFNKR